MSKAEAVAQTGETHAAEAHLPRRDDKLAAWSGIALVSGLAGDISRPVGNYSLWLFLAGIGALILCVVLRRFALPRRAIVHSSIFTAVMGTILVLQFVSPEEKDASSRGIAAAYVPVFASVQPSILPLSESGRTLLTFKNAMTHGSERERLAGARELLAETEDPSLRRLMIEEMASSSDPGLRPSGLLYQLASRRGDELSLSPINRDAQDPFSRALIAYTVGIRRVDTETGALDVFGQSWVTDATVTRSGISMPLYIAIEDDRRIPMLVELQLDNGLVLSGTARLEDGRSVPVEMSLF